MRNTLEQELDFEVSGEAGDARGAIEAASLHSPDIVLMDLSVPAPGGIEATARIKRELPSAGIIVLAQNDEEDSLFEAIKAGAAAFILKDVSPDDLVTIIGRVHGGEYLINDKVFARPEVASRVLKGVPRAGDLRAALPMRRIGHCVRSLIASTTPPIDERVTRTSPAPSFKASRMSPSRRVAVSAGTYPAAMASLSERSSTMSCVGIPGRSSSVSARNVGTRLRAVWTTTSPLTGRVLPKKLERSSS